MRSTRAIMTGIGAAACLALAGPALAQADTRYASPGGADGAACTEQAPCSIATALIGASSGAEIVLLPGDYAIAFPFSLGGGVTLRGRDGAAATRIALSASLPVSDARVADVTINGTVGSGAVVELKNGGIVERAVLRAVTGSGGSSVVQISPGGLVRDSVLTSSASSFGLYFVGASSATLRAEARNVSVVTTAAGSSALRMNLPNVGDPTQYTGRVRNSIFRGATKDLDVVGLGNQELQVGTSDFRAAFSSGGADVVDLGGNIQDAPQFFDQAGGDLHQLPGSPTIDKGVLDTFMGTTDLDGQPRTIAGGPDIGADEQPGPFPRPGSVAGTNLLVNGDAEAAPGATDAAGKVAVPGWTTTLGFTAMRYDAPGGFPSAPESARIGGGANFFTGGSLTDLGTAKQTVDVTRLASDIDAGRATATLSGDLGGFAAQADAADVTATFRSAAGAALGTLAIGPATPVDRGGATVLLRRSATRPAPAGTRSIEVLVRAVNPGSVSSYNDGYADNLVLTVAPPPAPAPGGNGGTTAADRTAPAITGLRLSKRSFRRNTSPRAKRPRSSQLRFTLSEAAAVRIAVQRRAPGVRVKGRCTAPRRTRRTPRCTRWIDGGSLSARGSAGANRIAITGIVGGRALSAGTYRLVLTATDAAGNAASATSATLTLKR